MASTPKQSGIAHVIEVARYLSVESEDVRRMIRLDKLPVIPIPMVTKQVYRVPLRDFHSWLNNRRQIRTPEFSSYENFLADFDRIRRGK